MHWRSTPLKRFLYWSTENESSAEAIASPQSETRAFLFQLHRQLEHGNWLQIHLEGRRSNRDAIGTLVYLWSEGKRQTRQVKAGSGFLSTSQIDPHFGLGAAESVERLEIHWPSGAVQTVLDISPNQRLHIVERSQ